MKKNSFSQGTLVIHISERIHYYFLMIRCMKFTITKKNKGTGCLTSSLQQLVLYDRRTESKMKTTIIFTEESIDSFLLFFFKA